MQGGFLGVQCFLLALLLPLGRILEMIGAVVLLCGLLGVFLWWLVKNYDEESSCGEEQQQQQPDHQRRRNRGNKGKKRKQRGGTHVCGLMFVHGIASRLGGFSVGWKF